MDKVYLNIDKILDETLKLVKIKVISQDECKKIMAKRKTLEIKLHGHNGKPSYLKYIAYELELDQLFHKRARKLNMEFDVRVRSAIRNCLQIFNRALYKYPKDESLWLNYLNIRIKRASREGTGKAFAEALQHIPRSPKLWKLAASYEFEVNKDIQAARNLIQAGTQFNEEDRSLWIHFFNMELSYISLLYNNLDESQNKVQLKQEDEGDEKISMNLDKLKKENGIEGSDKPLEGLITFGKEILNPAQLKNSALIRGQIASIIYKTAIKKKPHDFDFRKQFYKIAKNFWNVGKITQDEKGAGQLLQLEIMNSMKEDFKNDERIWFFIAKSQVNSGLDLKEIIKTLNQGLESNLGDSYVQGYHRFLIKYLTGKLTVSKDSQSIDLVQKTLIKLFKDNVGVLSEQSYQLYIDLLLESGLLKDAFKVTEEAVKRYPSSIALWSYRINLYLKDLFIIQQSSTTREQLEILLEEAIVSVQPRNPENSKIFLEYIKYHTQFKNTNPDLASVHNLLKKLFKLLDNNPHTQNQLKTYLIDYTFLNFPPEQLKLSYQFCFQYLPTTKELYQKCIMYEELNLRNSANKNYQEIRTLYERCLVDENSASTDAKLWFNYRNFELKITGDVSRSTVIANRAKKSLSDPIPFFSLIH
ncbi:U3 snoRNP protein [Tieghemostelium lacteum]|uniref:U3 snoRNP protein n=1 Tax=Tieghemostelium lacteum TaxID=361077 RepID=A0A151Z9P9_TIELA|nr:U3 snoRNP protein [Tieghemostelium lacteum]|eukprot:KYQ90655.1 U3 snoRNP protein [Tieghemostelium lacteum]